MAGRVVVQFRYCRLAKPPACWNPTSWHGVSTFTAQTTLIRESVSGICASMTSASLHKTKVFSILPCKLFRIAWSPAALGSLASSNRSMATSATSSKASSRLLSTGLDWEPTFIYGTAWKKQRTKELVIQAVQKGFRQVDTAAQPKHYQENLVGEALREAYAEGKVKRSDIYVSLRLCHNPPRTPNDGSSKQNIPPPQART